MPAHRGVADREDKQDHRDDDVHEQDTEQVCNRKTGGHATGDDSQRCRRGNHEENDVRNAERAAAQMGSLCLLGDAVNSVAIDRHWVPPIWVSPAARTEYSGIVRVQTIVSRVSGGELQWVTSRGRHVRVVWVLTAS